MKHLARGTLHAIGVKGCHYLLMWAHVLDDFHNWVFCLGPSSSFLVLPTLLSSCSCCCYSCAVIAVIFFLSSIPEVICLVKLHLFPRLPSLECSSSISCLGGCSHSCLVLGPRPWRPTSNSIHRHGDDPHLSPWRQPLNSSVLHPPQGLSRLTAACRCTLKHAWMHRPSRKHTVDESLGSWCLFFSTHIFTSKPNRSTDACMPKQKLYH